MCVGQTACVARDERLSGMRSTLRIGTVLLAVWAGYFIHAADALGQTTRVWLIAGQASEKGYIPRLEAIRALARESPLSTDERGALMAFLGSTDVSDGLPVKRTGVVI